METKTKILLIEDNLEMRENTAEILELANYSVITANNGKIGVDLATREKPDLIICDIMMPELDGYGVLYMLGKNSVTASIPFIFLTAKAEKTDMRKGMNLGADDYLTKPFDEMELLQAVETRLKKSNLLKKEFERGLGGFNEFIDQVKGIEELKKLSETRKVHHYKKKDFIYMTGDEPKGIFLITSGKVKTYKAHPEGKQLITGMYNEGDFIGYTDVLQESEIQETAEAMSDCELVVIPKNDFFTLLYSNRDVAARFIKMLSNNVTDKEDRLMKLAYNSVRKRVADALLIVKSRNNNQDSFTISREDLASLAGTATETVIRTLSDFKDEKLLDIKEKQVFLLDVGKLSKLKN
jgi:CRP/FNR family transcriptional regulator, polysaccharide utilization system transcription regulator